MAKFESSTIVKRKLWTEFVEDRERPGRPSEITEEKIDEVAKVIENEPQSSVLSVATACSISQTTAHRIMTEHLSLKPYKVQFVQKLYEEDMQDRVEMCKTLIPMLEDNHIQQNLFFSDEATFYLNGLVSKHNVRYWSETNPHVTIETVMKSPKLNVWWAMSKNRLVGPYFFADDTVNGNNYLSMLQNFII
ncbi:unnamed protein product [Rotaria magnacalcarata]